MYLNHYGAVKYELNNIIKMVNENNSNAEELKCIIKGLISTIDRVNRAENMKNEPDERVFYEILEGLKEV